MCNIERFHAFRQFCQAKYVSQFARDLFSRCARPCAVDLVFVVTFYGAARSRNGAPACDANDHVSFKTLREVCDQLFSIIKINRYANFLWKMADIEVADYLRQRFVRRLRVFTCYVEYFAAEDRSIASRREINCEADGGFHRCGGGDGSIEPHLPPRLFPVAFRRFENVAKYRRLFEIEVLRIRCDQTLYHGSESPAIIRQKQADELDPFIVFFATAQFRNARRETAMAIILRTWHRKGSIDIDVARTQPEPSVEIIDQDPRRCFGKKSPEVFTAVVLDRTCRKH